MNCLLDTHTYLWWLQGSPQLSPDAEKSLSEPENTALVSVVTFWELAIKISVGKLTLSQPLAKLAADLTPIDGFELLNIEIAHCLAVESLPFHHRDPFDRLLVCQALEKDLTVISKDVQLDKYGVSRVW